jgi:hypothetical protein
MNRRLRTTLIAAMLTVSIAFPGLASAQGQSDTAPNCEKGNDTAYFSPGAAHRSQQATESLDKVYFGKCLV